MDLDSFSLNDVKKLQNLIKFHSDLYYNKEEPIISDKEYDNLFQKLEKLENKFHLKNKQTLKVGADLKESSFKKVKHSRPMISLGNTYNEKDLKDFNERVYKNILSQTNNLPLGDKIIQESGVEYTLEFKFDGLGIELIYKKGKLIQAITRGNGIEGEDVTENIMQIDNIPKNIEYLDDLEVRGEVVMPISVFNELNNNAKKEGTKIFSNPRNAASGSIRMKDNRITKQRKLKFFAYDLANFETFRVKEKFNSYFDVIKKLEKLGFEISSYFKICKNIEEVIFEIKNFNNKKNNIDFEIDGLVVKVNNIKLWKEIGFTEHHPKYAIAYKFPAEVFTTKILSVDHQVGRTGTITPVANLEPINIGGAIIRRATLHNYEEVENLDIRIGDSVFIKRAGEVIPKIISVIKNGNRDNLEKIKVPEYCPSCKTKIIKDKEKVRYYCPNKIDCPAQHHEKLVFAVGKQGFNIDGLGEKQIELFLKNGIIYNLVDIFKISEKKKEILELEGFKEKSVNNLISGVEKAKNIDISTFITALGISGVGKKTAKTLSKLITSPLAPLLLGKGDIEELENLEDIGPEIAKNVINYFKLESHQKIIKELINILNISFYKEKNINTHSIFSGKKVCITGSFIGDNNKKISRDYLIKLLEESGGEFINNVSKNTDFLLAGEKAGSKLKKAKDLGIQIIDLTYFKNNL